MRMNLLFEKNISKTVAFLFVLTVNCCCFSQQMVQTSNDVKILEQKESEFIGKPLKELFKEIKPQINLVLARPENIEQASVFTFFFATKKEFSAVAGVPKKVCPHA